MHCKKCGNTNTVKNGRTPAGQQKEHCRHCGFSTVTGCADADADAHRNPVHPVWRYAGGGWVAAAGAGGVVSHAGGGSAWVGAAAPTLVG